MKEDPSHTDIIRKTWQGTFKLYLVGFLICLFLTLIAFYLVFEQKLEKNVLIATIVGLGSVQAIIQMVFFLHLGQESKPHWNLLVFLFMVLVIVVIVVGSLWIMNNLDYNVMPSMDMLKQGGL